MRFAAWLLLAVAPMLLGQDHPSADEIAAKLAAADDARAAKLQNFTSIRQYSMVNARFGVKARMTVRMSYQTPGPKKYEVLEQSGPGPIRSKVFRRMLDTEAQASVGPAREETRISPRNYDFGFVETRVDDGRKCFVLEISPKTDNRLLFRGRIYVDAEDYAVVYMDGTPAQNPSFWLRKTAVTQKYKKVGAFWLPALNASNSDVRVFGHSEVRIEYADYQVNAANSSASGQ